MKAGPISTSSRMRAGGAGQNVRKLVELSVMNRTPLNSAVMNRTSFVFSSIAALLFLFAAGAEAQVKPRIMVVVDTSGTMRLDLNGIYTWGDGVGDSDCERGIDTDCDGLINDSRMYVAKEAIANMVRAYGDVEWSLSRFSQTQEADVASLDYVCGSNSILGWGGNPQCNSGNVLTGSCDDPLTGEGGFTGIPLSCRPGENGNPPGRFAVTTPPQNADPRYTLNYWSTCDGADVLVGWPGLGAFASKGNENAILKWLDGDEDNPLLGTTTEGNFCNHAGGGDCELRGRGPTPLAASLAAAQNYITPIRSGDGKRDCRPYSVILLTDGLESCATNPNAPKNAAQDLKAAGVNVYVVGLSITSTERPALNQIASSGGTTAYFADDQDTLAAALSDIVRQSLLIEVCNGDDDDCDDLVDEGFTKYCNLPAGVTGLDLCNDPGERQCDNQDDNCDGDVDEGVINACGSCGAVPTEVCDGVDNDCDVAIDEMNVCDGCIKDDEICDNLDNDCDNKVDESLQRICGNDVGQCSTGTQTCSAGVWGQCTGRTPIAEVCDNQDNDCDGVVDGMVRPCGESTGACQPGNQTCTKGTWGTCVGEIGESAEVCDGLDNDCNGTVDDNVAKDGEACGSGMCSQGKFECVGGSLICIGMNTGGAETCNDADDDCDGKVDEGLGLGDPCGSSTGDCRPGTRICQGGQVVCSGGVGDGEEVCDLRDNDCDGVVDEDLQSNELCGTDEGQCMQGTLQCVRGQQVCVGEVPPGLEVCDCEDNDCDGEIDENPEAGGICPGDSACLECQCAGPCQQTREFGNNCPPGKTPFEQGDACYCVGERCNESTCGAETIEIDNQVRCAPDTEGVSSCVCKNNACTFPCEGVVCPEGTICNPRDDEGRCEEDSCRGLGCAEGELCDFETGACDVDPCAGMDCGDQACRGGACETPCAVVECAAGQSCSRGECAADACAGVTCNSLEFCDPTDGVCKNNPCRGVRCPAQSVCDPNTGMCAPDPCAGLHCPGDLLCIDGECLADEDVTTTPDAGVADAGGQRVLASGSGCTCAVDKPSPQPLWLGLLVLAALIIRRRDDASAEEAVSFGSSLAFSRNQRFADSKSGSSKRALITSSRDDASAEEPGRQAKHQVYCAISAILLVCGACDVEPYCLDCAEEGDGRVVPKPDGNVQRDATVVKDASLPDATPDAAPPGVEVCNGADEDGDGKIDETFDLQADPRNCGKCGNECAIANAFSECRAGECAFTMCDVGFYDLNSDESDGCEYRCLPRAEDDAKCDLVDEDCDGKVDEDIDKMSNPLNCGECGRRCIFGNAEAGCTGGKCVLTACQEGYVDLDKQPGTGCEYACNKVADEEVECNLEDDDCDGIIDEGNPEGGSACGETRGECTAGTEVCTAGTLACQNAGLPVVESCDEKDNDCDGSTDEAFALQTDINNCGKCGNSCNLAGAVMRCNAGKCEFVRCQAGLSDANGDIGSANSDGCEYACTFAGSEICNGQDDDCDNKVDEAVSAPSNFCNPNGVCGGNSSVVCNGKQGWGCEYGGDYEEAEMTCDDKDNDCDGKIDEGFPVGDACDNGRDGECKRRGMRKCDGTGTTTVCDAPDVASGSAEKCDGKDNDCDGDVDEMMSISTIATVPFSNRDGDTVRIMAYEASRPDASASEPGSMNTVACSTKGHLPWTNVTWQQAKNACCALNASGTCPSNGTGWRLCSADDWQDACEANNTCTWSYENSCSSSQPLVCNGEEHDSAGNAGDQDSVYVTGSTTFPACFAALPNGDVFDMSGNIKEWTSTERGSSTVHEIRGGSYNNIESGRTCQFSFTAGNNQFQFPNTGFRCCLY